MTKDHDIVIAGGGPAAVALARQLYHLGYRTTVITRPRPFPAIEGFSPRTLDLVARFCGGPGASDLISRTVHWNGRSGAANREALIDRSAFDRALLDNAATLGIQVIEGRVRFATQTSAGWRLAFRMLEGGDTVIDARFLVEARGRAAPLGCGGRVRGPALVCLSRRWRFGKTAAGEAGVASFVNGWAWFIRQPTGDGLLQIFVDPADRLPSGDRLTLFYDDQVKQSPEATEWLQGGVPGGGVRARHAGMVLRGQLRTDHYLRVGDAAMAIDPLSGHGVYKGISGALAAAPVINTLVKRPADAALAQNFYRERVADDFWASARIARDFYGEEQRWAEKPFWRTRRAWPDTAPAHPPIRAGEATVTRRGVSRNGFVEEQEVLVTPDQPRGVWHVAGLSAAEVWAMLGNGRPTAESLARKFGVAPEAAKAAVAWFRERGLVGGDD